MRYVYYDQYVSKVVDILLKKGKKVSEESVRLLLESSAEALLESFKDSPSVQVEPLGWFEVSPLASRVHVLRGVKYESHQRYKVKLYIHDDMHESIKNIYDRYRED